MDLRRTPQAPAVDAMLEAIGPRWHEDIVAHSRLVIDAYTQLLAARPEPAPPVRRDLAYGAHPRQRLDVYGDASRGAEPSPIAVFVHGGAFVRGQKDVTSEVYANVPRYFARRGWIGVNVEYRLAPEARFPAGGHDVAAAVDYVRRHAGDWGGRRDGVVLIGHSAGGCHAATYAWDPMFASSGSAPIAALVLIGARVRADARSDNPNADAVRAYFGDDAALYDQRSPATYAARATVPALVAVAEFENPHLDRYGLEVFETLSAAQPRAGHIFVRLLGHTHTSAVTHFDTADETLGRAIDAFARRSLASQAREAQSWT
ncbi:MAG: alpha/beta hydrolase [Vicinamibacterales bacterium]